MICSIDATICFPCIHGLFRGQKYVPLLLTVCSTSSKFLVVMFFSQTQNICSTHSRDLFHMLIRPKCIYFPEHFCYCFSSNLCVLNTTNTDWRCFQQNCSSVSFLCRNPTFSKNSGKIIKNPISPEDPRSQKTRRRGGSRAPHTQGARPSPGRAHLVWGRLGRPLDLSFRLRIPPDSIISGRRRFSQIDFRCAAAIRNRDSKPETPFWHPVETGIWRRSSSPSSPTSLHRPSMTPPSMCE
jgi:hypothetical protein